MNYSLDQLRHTEQAIELAVAEAAALRELLESVKEGTYNGDTIESAEAIEVAALKLKLSAEIVYDRAESLEQIIQIYLSDGTAVADQKG